MLLSAQHIKSCAARVGFAACGIARAVPLSETDWGLYEWLAAGCQADMRYMEEYAALRHNPALLLEGARSVIALLVPYKYDRLMDGPARIAQYAYDEDYHERLKRMLYQLIAALREQYPDFGARPCVDTAPVSDKLWAARAGLGWIGHNTLLINPKHGSFCFLGELLTTAEVDHYDSPLPPPDNPTETALNDDLKQGTPPKPSLCGGCRRCVDACPNGAIVPHHNGQHTRYHIDARRCTSYNTIENRHDTLSPSLRPQGYIFGCDICQLACPYNQQAPAAALLTDERKAQLEALAQSNDPQLFKRAARHSPLNRIRFPQWQRNRECNG